MARMKEIAIDELQALNGLNVKAGITCGVTSKEAVKRITALCAEDIRRVKAFKRTQQEIFGDEEPARLPH